MFPGSPARIRASWPLRLLLPLANPGAVLGVWLRGCARPAAIRCHAPAGVRHLLIAEDLGYLLRRCAQVVVRDGERMAPVASGILVGWRVLEVVLGAPYLPTPDQLRALFPAARLHDGVLTLPLGLRSAEEALAVCSAERLPVAATRIGYLAAQR